MATHLRTELVLDALDMALWQRRPEADPSLSGHAVPSIAFGLRCKPGGSMEDMLYEIESVRRFAGQCV